MTRVRSHNSNPETITPLLLQLFARWNEFGKKPFALNAGESGFLLEDTGLKCALGDALQKMRCAMTHGIKDERGSHDCLYVTFSTKESFTDAQRAAMSMMMPHIDTALRQVTHLPHQAHTALVNTSVASLAQTFDISEREAEVLCWVAMGKTNPEIGCILNISAFTVKNHMQRVFKKLNVTNRAQAVGIYKTYVNNA
jgi:transcriptional regulator EpsA